MRRFTSLFLVVSLFLFSGCSAARRAIGVVSDLPRQATIVGNTATPDATPAPEASQQPVAPKIVHADDNREAAKHLPQSLQGDSDHALHSGDPVIPQ